MDSDKKNILQISVRADIGGGPEHLYRIVKGFSSKINCTVAIPNDKPYYELFCELLGKENVILIPHRKFTLSHLHLLKKEITKRNISIIHSHGKGAGIYSRLLGILTGKRVIHTLHGFHIGNYTKLQRMLYIILEKLLSLFTYRIITVSEGEKNKILSDNLCNPQKIIVIPNGVEIPNQKVEPLNFEKLPRIFITFSRFNFQKNTQLLIEIGKKLSKTVNLEGIEFHVYGDGEDFENLKKSIINENLEGVVILKGADPEARTKLIDGFCYISTSRWEGLPLSLLEAMAVGLPVLATDVVGNNDIIIDGKNGLLFDIDKIEEVAGKIIQLTSDFELWKKFSVNSRSTVAEKFSIDKMINETEKVYSI